MILLTASGSLKAQTFDEWFRQKKTQRKYLLQQIAALQVYIGYARKGYDIASQGLGMVGKLSGSELSLHNGYFLSLRTVNPFIKRHPKVARILALLQSTLRIYTGLKADLLQMKTFTPEELLYTERVYNRLFRDVEQLTSELTVIISDGVMQLSDDERTRRIDLLYEQAEDQYAFAVSFAGNARLLGKARKYEENDIINSRALHGIKPR